jgi:hypothetical protein
VAHAPGVTGKPSCDAATMTLRRWPTGTVAGETDRWRSPTRMSSARRAVAIARATATTGRAQREVRFVATAARQRDFDEFVEIELLDGQLDGTID